MEQWLSEFLEDLQRRNYSPASIRAYRYDLQLFVQWVSRQEHLNTPADLTLSALENYQMHLMLRPSLKSKNIAKAMSTASRNRHTAELRSFFRYLKRVCKLLSNPSAELECARQLKTLPKTVFTVEEMAGLLEHIPKNTPCGLRDWAAVELLYATGLRRFELLNLEISALRLAEEMVHILGKGQKERVVPFRSQRQRGLERYLSEGRPYLVEGAHHRVFVSQHHGGPVSEEEMLQAIRRHARRAEISQVTGFHQFRHTCATHMLRGGADLRCIQTILGHSQLSTTAIYTKVEVADLKKTMRECHPREKDTD
ncbi:MAG: tyrosine-type recombinase/integrase [Proteobacteria bacterium]|nr:tyrosine-type recombinase/integrase [Pseudomonadota bacterium]